MSVEFTDKASWLLLGSFNVRWYAHMAREAMIKYKILTIFIVCLLAPSVSFLIKIATGPANVYLYSGQASLSAYSLFMIAIQLFSIVYALLHRAVFVGRQWDDYMSSLPMTVRQRALSDVMILILANSFILLTMICAFLTQLASINLSFAQAFMRLIFLMLMMCLIQLSIIYKDKFSLFYAIFLGLSTILVVRYASSPLQVLITGAASFLLCHQVKKIYFKKHNKDGLISFFEWVKLGEYSLWVNLILLNVKIALNDYSRLLVYLLPIAMMIGFYTVLMVSDVLPKNICLTVLLFVSLFCAFLLSNVFKPVYNCWEEYKGIIQSLPLSRYNLLSSLYFLGLLSTFFLNLFLLSAFVLIEKNVNVFVFYIINGVTFLYLLYCFYAQIHFKRYGVLASLLGLMPFYFFVKLFA